jgi:hypothetical protein
VRTNLDLIDELQADLLFKVRKILTIQKIMRKLAQQNTCLFYTTPPGILLSTV